MPSLHLKRSPHETIKSHSSRNPRLPQRKSQRKYLGTGELDHSNDHPSKTKRNVKNAILEKYEQLA